ncbi:MAG: sigma-70 family RNA polymerase sigma factor [Bdellovibrio sp.]|nr:sigma-70 family RNA polymerase sigma factor [Bdellovibrio sp.]
MHKDKESLSESSSERPPERSHEKSNEKSLEKSHEKSHEKSDEELMKDYQEGSQEVSMEAFQLLYKKHSGKIWGYTINHIRDHAKAEDVFQTTFLKLHQFRSRYNTTLPFLPWLFTICRNTMLDFFRKESQLTKTQESFTIETQINPQTQESPHEHHEHKDQLFDINTTSLNPQQKEALKLRYQDQLSFEEIAKTLSTTTINVRQMISRAVRKIKTTKGVNI